MQRVGKRRTSREWTFEFRVDLETRVQLNGSTLRNDRSESISLQSSKTWSTGATKGPRISGERRLTGEKPQVSVSVSFIV